MVNRPGKPGQNRNEFSPFVRFEKKTGRRCGGGVPSIYLLKAEIILDCTGTLVWSVECTTGTARLIVPGIIFPPRKVCSIISPGY